MPPFEGPWVETPMQRRLVRQNQTKKSQKIDRSVATPISIKAIKNARVNKKICLGMFGFFLRCPRLFVQCSYSLIISLILGCYRVLRQKIFQYVHRSTLRFTLRFTSRPPQSAVNTTYDLLRTLLRFHNNTCQPCV